MRLDSPRLASTQPQSVLFEVQTKLQLAVNERPGRRRKSVSRQFQFKNHKEAERNHRLFCIILQIKLSKLPQ